MKIIKRRPKLRVLVPRVVHPGEHFDASFELEIERAVPIEHFDVTLRGKVQVAVGDRGYAESGVPISQSARLSGPCELEPGLRRFSCRFKLPPDAPPSFDGRIVHASYVLGAQLAIPWWLDLDRNFTVTVVHAPVKAAGPPRPLLYSSAPDGPAEREPHAEVSIADGVVQAGDVIRGAVALGNVAFARYTGVRVALSGHEYAHGMERGGPFGSWQIDLPLAELREGDPIPFALRVPDVFPTFESGSFRIWWLLDVTVTRRLGADLVVSMPIVVRPRGSVESSDSKRLMSAPPTVGNARVQAVWSVVAKRAGMNLEGERLEARVGAIDVSLYRDHPGGHSRLVAELDLPDLGLELTGETGSVLARFWGPEGVAFGSGGFGVRGRDEEQVRALVAGLEPEIGSARVRYFDDTRLVLETSGAGLTAEPVFALAASALAIAGKLPELTRTLPGPTGVELAPWRELADAFGGALAPARPRVEGALDGRRVVVAQAWAPGGVQAKVELSVGSRSPIDAKFIDVDPFSDVVPSEARALVKGLVSEGAELTICADRVTLSLPGTVLASAPMLSAAEELGLFVDVLTRRGAYR